MKKLFFSALIALISSTAIASENAEPPVRPTDPGAELFERVLLLGAGLSVPRGEEATEETPDPIGDLITRQLPETWLGERTSRAWELACSWDHWDWAVKELPEEQPTLVIAIDLFFHEFATSMWIEGADKERMTDIVRLLAETNAPVYLGNSVPFGVYWAPKSANRHLSEQAENHSKIRIIDLYKFVTDLGVWGWTNVWLDGKKRTVRHKEVLDSDNRITDNGRRWLANLIIDRIRGDYPEMDPENLPFLKTDRR